MTSEALDAVIMYPERALAAQVTAFWLYREKITFSRAVSRPALTSTHGILI